jgi:hypothetical protein
VSRVSPAAPLVGNEQPAADPEAEAGRCKQETAFPAEEGEVAG